MTLTTLKITDESGRTLVVDAEVLKLALSTAETALDKKRRSILNFGRKFDELDRKTLNMCIKFKSLFLTL